MNRLQLLEQAASLDPRTFAANALVARRDYERACRNNWAPWDGKTGVEIDDAESEIPVLDSITQMPLAKDDVVVLSDGQCYSKRSMADLVRQGVVRMRGDDYGRANLPLSGSPLTDLDYALLGFEPPTAETSAAALARTSDVTFAAMRAEATDEQRAYEERRREQGLSEEQVLERRRRVEEQRRIDESERVVPLYLTLEDDMLMEAIAEEDIDSVRELAEQGKILDYGNIRENDALMIAISELDHDQDFLGNVVSTIFERLPRGRRFSRSMLDDLFTETRGVTIGHGSGDWTLAENRQMVRDANWPRRRPDLFVN